MSVDDILKSMQCLGQDLVIPRPWSSCDIAPPLVISHGLRSFRLNEDPHLFIYTHSFRVDGKSSLS